MIRFVFASVCQFWKCFLSHATGARHCTRVQRRLHQMHRLDTERQQIGRPIACMRVPATSSACFGGVRVEAETTLARMHRLSALVDMADCAPVCPIQQATRNDHAAL